VRRWTRDDLATISVTVNGRSVRRAVEPRWLLSDFLREELGMTGTHVGCEHGVCGACTVLVNGRAVRSCLTLAVAVDGHEVTTIEGLREHPQFSPLAEAFHGAHALQCGFCTPGMVVSLLGEVADARSDAPDWQDVLSGHLCRCTGYDGIRRAVEQWRGVQEATRHESK
jgi:aerobic-type carbon monoxide dehydrogenase small subunit (CoxS/CutS family)